MGTIQIELIGPLRVTGPDGKVLTPKAPRVRALLALLAEPPLRKRNRRWLVAHLWSDRPYEKSSMSLRNALLELRKSLGAYSGAIRADRTDIWFDPELVVVDLARATQKPAAMTLLEGLDITDDAFNDWLRDLRSGGPQASDTLVQPDPVQGITVVSKVGEASSSTCRTSAGIIADMVSQNLEDMVGSVRSATAVGRSDIEITTRMSESSGHAMLSAQVIHGPTDTVLYSGYREYNRPGGAILSEQDVAEFSHNVAVRALAKLPHVGALDRDEIVAIGFAEVARRRLFSYRHGEVEASGRLFRQAFDADPSGVFLAWQAFQKTARVIEGMTNRTPDLLEESDRLLRRAAELAPESARVHGLTALVRLMLFDDPAGGLNAAEMGMRRNRNCLLSHQAFAMAAGAFGDKVAAYNATSFCRPAIANDDARHLWDLYHGLVCIATDRHDEALSALQDAARRCPSFKAPHRQLIALYMHRGDVDHARHHLSQLYELEEGFTLDAFIHDPEYPADTLRQTGLLTQSFEALR